MIRSDAEGPAVIDFNSFVGTTIRARCAFALFIADLLLDGVSNEVEGYREARSALEAASAWLRGEGVGGDALGDLLMNQHDEGLFVHLSIHTPRETDTAYNVLGAAISYIRWHEYRQRGSAMPEDLELASESLLQWMLDEAATSAQFDAGRVRLAHERFIERYPARGPEELGAPIDFDVLCDEIGYPARHPPEF